MLRFPKFWTEREKGPISVYTMIICVAIKKSWNTSSKTVAFQANNAAARMVRQSKTEVEM